MTRREAITLGLLYGGYLVVATFYPFDVSRGASQGFSQNFFGSLNKTDFILNVLLFIPFGILLYLGLAPNRSKPWKILLTSVVAAAISLVIELFQVYFPRNPSGYDVISNTLGAGCGALLSALLPSRCIGLIARLWHTATRSWVAVLVAVLLGAAPMLLSLVQLFQPFGVWNSRFTFQIGNEATLDRPWLGQIHFVALYSRGLSADEIRNNFGAGPLGGMPLPEDVLLLYTFSEGRGSVVHDRSGVNPVVDLAIAPEGHVRWHHSANGIDIMKPAIMASSQPATKLVKAARASNELSIEIWMTPSSITQAGPARIVSFSADAGARNFTLGQEGSKIEFRLRTPITGRNGIPLAVKSSDEISTFEKSHVVATYKNGVERLYVNGKQQAEVLNLTRDGIIAFGTRRTPVTAAAYSFFYFFTVSFLSVTFLLAHAKILIAVLSSVVIGAGLAVLTETFQTLAFSRNTDIWLLFFGLVMPAMGAVSGRISATGERL